MDHIDLSRPQPDLAIVRLKGAGKYNLMSYAMLHELWAVANEIQSDPAIRAVVVCGSDSHFSAGMNLKQDEVKGYRELSTEQRLAVHAIGARACAAWEALDAVTVCAIEGYCLGGGLAFSVVCDFRVATSETVLGAPELLNGMSMSWQSLPRLVALVGPARTRKLVMLADNIDAAKAESWGMVDEISAPGAAKAEAETLAHRLLEIPGAPLRMTKHAIGQAANALNHAVSYMDLEQYVTCQATDAHSDALDAFFKGR
ncbi:enoyl-CoA hydratase/isomerase family protein [Sulfitobacter sp. F26169L]|uniref:enoyl-CoA hydratase/isomerase family protein n=1 Tax=Sulfitobacter sp. F26169L TaxID=2996015 RepID=UPI002260D206|nr:enoyl-CoA hydratase/isomerase family protein [Sulfitobacter sp. F26169L]MCX7567965.1 enoyl-CoA hydratase/isomerase family protein [Sulfitobacter sp. F26169L]